MIVDRVFIFFKIELFILERGNPRGGAREEGEKEFQANSLLNVESNARFHPTTLRAWLELKPRVDA